MLKFELLKDSIKVNIRYFTYFLIRTIAYVSNIKNHNNNKELGRERCAQGFFFCFKMLGKQIIEDTFEYSL